ncbi:hypothetical protein F5148DRAFT_394674 [Russula earlei]|uniref:Uncharacterized protein n=1 Tax=Russula earlei TaxID=71964 RepID=A0ACC0TZT0_9AGAM|nr:hypothetical protein F5148DRAFT_394674 [Russula earlei]
MRDLAGEIMASVLTILGIVTKRMKRGKIKRNLKRLQGNSHLKDEIHKFTCLIHEEVGLAIAEQSKMGNREVIRVDEGFQGVSGDMEDLGRRSEELDNIAQGVGGNESDIRKKEKAQGLDRKLHLVNRNPLQDSLLRWLSPPDPSINYNTARKACHNGTARWFFRGTVFNHWKSTPSLLWLHGKRAFLITFDM